MNVELEAEDTGEVFIFCMSSKLESSHPSPYPTEYEYQRNRVLQTELQHKASMPAGCLPLESNKFHAPPVPGHVGIGS